mmetsp:Transcript_26563/g.36756  ORF Transcript_26563/g.36756 Transcript_26563/m.36756 type:complete len:288 (-) Transcript_26563:122-985(-)
MEDPKNGLGRLRSVIDEFKAGYKESTYAMRKRVEDLLKQEHSLGAELNRTANRLQACEKGLKSAHDDARRRGVRERELFENSKQVKTQNISYRMEIQRLEEATSRLHTELLQERKDSRNWEEKYIEAVRRAEKAEALASTRKARADSLEDQLTQYRAQLAHSREEIETLRRQRQQESQAHDARVNLLMSRIVQAERAKKHSMLSQERIEKDADFKVREAQRRADQMRMGTAERESNLASKRELFILRSKQNGLEKENRELHQQVKTITAERNLLKEQVGKLTLLRNI